MIKLSGISFVWEVPEAGRVDGLVGMHARRTRVTGLSRLGQEKIASV